MQDIMLIGLVIKKHNYIQVCGVIPFNGICCKILYTNYLTIAVLFISKRCGCKCKMLLFTAVAKFLVY